MRPIRSIGIFTVLVLSVAAMACATAENHSEVSEEEKAGLYLDAASQALSAGDSTDALRQILVAEKLDPSSAPVQHTKALIFFAKKDVAQAIAFARKAVELDPKYSAANNTLGKLLVEEGRADEGIPYLLRAARDPLYREAYKPWTSLGIYHYRRGEYADAKQFLDHAIDSSPQLACIAYYYRGHVDLQKGDMRSAIKDYDLATRKFCANFADAHLALGIAYERTKDFTNARKKFLEIQDRFSDTAAAEQAINHLKYLP